METEIIDESAIETIVEQAAEEAVQEAVQEATQEIVEAAHTVITLENIRDLLQENRGLIEFIIDELASIRSELGAVETTAVIAAEAAQEAAENSAATEALEVIEQSDAEIVVEDETVEEAVEVLEEVTADGVELEPEVFEAEAIKEVAPEARASRNRIIVI